ncbi:thiosulfate sulfurtransferase (rhodanese)-like domain-containing protein 2 [Phytophthora boehmeriae]|uniref:Thiosulfate sulfurtransferase (Rhodanese)-like domain-containing protein 2 n=1 Tax=Phytophthora boehmeriae TaxID=109152 RepID=A0A8T1WWQ9_9STRA|nr:thiosulfate sulfurtransferase (rhodanese)-like domain-containing protein 2 [Phytophthora boehmeriae]
METQWRRGRQELYNKLERSAENGLNHDAVLASRELFTFDALGRAAPKAFSFQHDDDAVTVVCAEIPRSAAEQWGEITREVLQELSTVSKENSEEPTQTKSLANIVDVYVSDLDIMHITLFYTSHPDDLAPRDAHEHKSERLSREIALVKELATQFETIRMAPVKVVLAASGAILLLLECLPSDEFGGQRRKPAEKNDGGNAEFSVDLLREAAKQTLPFVSAKSPHAIIHSTLARIMSPTAFDETALGRVRDKCQRISQRFAASKSSSPNDNEFVVSKLWYVHESHYIRPTGHTTTISLETDMSSSECTEEEAQWRRQRSDLYEELYRGGKTALNRESVRATREHFTPGATLESKPYVFPSENDAVALICAPIPEEMAKRCHDIGTHLTELLPREPKTNNAVSCITRQDLMHVTLFHTSHPGDLAPNAKLRVPEDISQLKAMCKRFAPFCMAPVRVLMASSGAIIMVFKCLPAAKEDGIVYDDEVVNKHVEFSVDHMRRVAKETFSYAPKTDTRVIIHATLGRVLSPDTSEEDLDRLRAKCEEITAELEADPQPALFDKLWYVQETHHLSPQGPKTDIPLLGGVQ